MPVEDCIQVEILDLLIIGHHTVGSPQSLNHHHPPHCTFHLTLSACVDTRVSGDIGISLMYLYFDVVLCLESVTCCFLPSCTKCQVVLIM
jgi:hypothetical protein